MTEVFHFVNKYCKEFQKIKKSTSILDIFCKCQYSKNIDNKIRSCNFSMPIKGIISHQVFTTNKSYLSKSNVTLKKQNVEFGKKNSNKKIILVSNNYLISRSFRTSTNCKHFEIDPVAFRPKKARAREKSRKNRR